MANGYFSSLQLLIQQLCKAHLAQLSCLEPHRQKDYSPPALTSFQDFCTDCPPSLPAALFGNSEEKRWAPVLTIVSHLENALLTESNPHRIKPVKCCPVQDWNCPWYLQMKSELRYKLLLYSILVEPPFLFLLEICPNWPALPPMGDWDAQSYPKHLFFSRNFVFPLLM